MAAALHSLGMQKREEEEKVLNLDRHLTEVTLDQNWYTPNDPKWATPLQVALPSFYRPRRRAPYNVGPLPTHTFPSPFLAYMCTLLHNADLLIFLGFPLVAKNLHDTVHHMNQFLH